MALPPASALYDRDWLASAEFRRRLLATLAALVAYRVLSHVPLPGLTPGAMAQYLGDGAGHGGGWAGLLSASSSLRISVMTIGIMPVFTSYAMVELLRLVAPSFRRWLAADPQRQTTVWRSVILLAIAMTIVQAFGAVAAMEGISGLVQKRGLEFRIGAVVALTGGVVIAIALAQAIGRYGLGQGAIGGMAVLLAGQLVPQLLVSPVHALESLAAGRLGPGMALAVCAYTCLGVAIFLLLAGASGGPGAPAEPAVNPGRYWPPFLANISPWLMYLLVGPFRPVPDAVLLWMLAGFLCAFTLFFCWLYERMRQQDQPEVFAGSSAARRAAIPAAGFLLVFAVWFVFWRLVPFPGIASPFALALVTYTLASWLRPSS